MLQTIAAVVIFAAMVISYSLNKIPMALTSIIGALLLVILGCTDAASVLSTLGSSTVVIMISMFVIGSAIGKTSLTDRLAERLASVSEGSFRKVLTAYVLFTFLLGQFMPTTTSTVALVCPMAIGVCRKMGVHPSKMLYSLALVTVATSWTLTPLGPYAANYIESNGMLAEYGLSAYSFTLFDEMIDKLPCTAFVLLWAIFAAPRLAPNITAAANNYEPNGSVQSLEASSDTMLKNSRLKPWQEITVYSVFSFVIVALCFNSFGLASWLIPAFGACAVVLTGAMNRKEVQSSLGLDIVMIYIGASALGNAFAATGAGNIIGDLVASVFGSIHNSYAIGAVFFVSAYIMTSLIYNRAVSKILIPIILISSISMNCDPRGLMRMCYIGSMCSLMTPMSTTAVPIIMGGAGYTQRDLFKLSIIPAIIMCAVSVLFVMSRYPCW